MTLRRRLFSMAGTLILAVSPTAIVLAQDAQAPTGTNEAPANPSPEEPLKRHKMAVPPAEAQENAPAAGEGNPPPKARPPKPQKPAGVPAAPAQAPATAQPAKPQAPAVAPSPQPNGEAPGKPYKSQQPAAGTPQEYGAPAAPVQAPAAPQPAKPQTPMVAPAVPAQTPAAAPTDQHNGQVPRKPRKGQQAGGMQQDGDALATPGPAALAPAHNPINSTANLMRDPRPAGQLSDDELQQRLQASQRLLANPGLTFAERAQLQRVMQLSAQEIQRRQQNPDQRRNQVQSPGQQPVPAPNDGRPTPPLNQNAVNPAAEQRAIGLLADNTPFDGMTDQVLRQRLALYRSVLAGGNLSPGTERGLIQRLNSARNTVRGRVASQEDGAPPVPGTSRNDQPQPGQDAQFGRPQFRQGPPSVQDIPAILADRRPSNVLTIDQLNRRILVYRDATNDQRYSSEDRDSFTQYLDSDRAELRNRLLSDRSQRDDRLRRSPPGRQGLDIDVVPRGRPLPQSVWAAEVDDDQIEQQFAARPLRPLTQRYPRSVLFDQPEMVMEQPIVRQALPSVELDTIHFGFNESFIREEEIANLDRVGRIIERILAAHPNEIFMIEGNTDAVGDEAYNLALSKKRADAVKQALTQYFVISPGSLATAGLGERYLKIPTPDPEQENRRVTVRRVTPLLQN